jgi:L-amino acid N-acyltransferase YncA
MLIRPCTPSDTAAICTIYNYYIEHTVITFEETPLSVAQMQERINTYIQRYPWLVCEVDGEVVGYAYASKWKERVAYKHTAEITVYLKHDIIQKGYGSALYAELIAQLKTGGCHVALGCIAIPNEPSVKLHERLGFQKVAHFTAVGRKFDRWLDVGYWQKTL